MGYSSFGKTTRQAGAVIPLIALAIYLLLFSLLSAESKNVAPALSVLPIIAVGWTFGLRAGVVAAVLSVPLNTVLLNLAGQPGWDALIRTGGGVLGTIALLAAGAAVGRLSDLWGLLEKEVAERRRIEKEFRERTAKRTEAKLVGFLNALPFGVVVHGRDTKLQYVNHYALQLLGVPPEKVNAEYSRILEEGIKQFPIYRSGANQSFASIDTPVVRALEGEQVKDTDIELAISGRRIPLEVFASPIFDEKGEVQFAVTAFQDISDRMRLEETLSAIYLLGRDLALIHDEDAIGRRVVEEAHHLLNFEAAGFGLADEQSRELIYGYSILGFNEEDTVLRLPLDEKQPKSISAKVYQTGVLMNVPDVSKESLYHQGRPDWEGRSELCVPIRVGDRIPGVLNAESRQLNRFSRDDEPLVQALADQCGVAVENARLYGELQQRLKEQTALQNAVSAIASKIELNDVLNEIANRLGEAIDSTSVFICEYDNAQVTSRVVAQYVGAEANEKERGPIPAGPISIPEFFHGTLEKLRVY